MVSLKRYLQLVFSVASLCQLSYVCEGRARDTGRKSQGDGDLDGNVGSHSGNGEGFDRGFTGPKGGLLVPR